MISKIEIGEIERRIKVFKARAAEAGLKMTHQRLEIFGAVAASLEHPDAEAILKALKPGMPTLSLDTVYRTLWLLHNLGVITLIGLKRQSVRFDANLAKHHHFLCERCGLIRDFSSPELDKIRIPAGAKAFGTALQARVEIRGICEKCAKRKPRKRR